MDKSYFDEELSKNGAASHLKIGEWSTEINSDTNLFTLIQNIYSNDFLVGCKTYKHLLDKIIRYHRAQLYVGTGVGGILICKQDDNEYVLLYQRKKDPENGLWCMPGGSVQYLKSIQDSLIEKFHNITNLKITRNDLRLLRVTNHFHTETKEPEYHYLSPAFLVEFDESILNKYPLPIADSRKNINGKKNYKDASNIEINNYEVRWHTIKEIQANKKNYTITTLSALKTYIEINNIEAKILEELTNLKNYKNYDART